MYNRTKFIPLCLPLLYSLCSDMCTAGKIRIMGRSVYTAQQMQQYLLKKNPQVPKRYLTLPAIYLEEGTKESVRGDLAFAQALHETNFFKFGLDVLPIQNNFAGLGAVGNREHGLFFKTPREGVRAQIQHLKAYASTKALQQPAVDPRFSLVKRGCAPYLEDLAGRWAYPGYDPKRYPSLEAAKRAHATYGDRIRLFLEEIYRTKVTPSPTSLTRHKPLSPHIPSAKISSPKSKSYLQPSSKSTPRPIQPIRQR